jgi:hypothetical protein
MTPLLRLSAALALASAAAAAAAAWQQLAADAPASGPAPRSGAILLGVSGAGGAGGGVVVALSGGCSSSCCYAPLGDLWLFASGAWANVSAQTGAPALPSPRLYHSASASASAAATFFVFGGTDVETGVLNDLWRVGLSLAPQPLAARWQLLEPPAPRPPARSGHSQSALRARSGAAGDAFVVFGGESEESTLADAWLYTPAAAASAADGAWSLLASGTGGGPGPRTQHAAVAVALPLPPGAAGSFARALVVSGGSDALGDDHADVWLLALDASPPAWLRLGAPADAADAAAGGAAWPSVRHGHAMWEVAAGAAEAAAGAAASGAAVLTLLLFGGQNCSVPDPANFLPDTWRFSVALDVAADGSVALAGGAAGTFTLVDAGAGVGPGPRALAGFVADGAVLAGGFSGYDGGTDDRLHNDVWQAAGANATR